MDLSSLEGDGQVNSLILQEGEADLILEYHYQLVESPFFFI